MAGIAGSAISGAYSIVISHTYDELDEDRGDYIYYSASNAHNNTDKNKAAPSAGAEALYKSYQTKNDVRVLRSKGAKHYAPRAGIQYHGL
jgi:SAD/SRA domain